MKGIKRQRLFYIDCIRCLACFLVIVIHSPMPGADNIEVVVSMVNFLAPPCNALFFMVSGALLLPVNSNMMSFYKHRLSKLATPLLLWTFFYVCYNVITGKTQMNELLKVVCSIPFSPQGNGVLWFVYVIMGLYLIAPIISPWLKQIGRRELQLVLFLWVIVCMYPTLSHWLIISEGHHNGLYYFGGYLVYFILGYYLRYNVVSFAYNNFVYVLFIAIPIITYGAGKYCNWEIIEFTNLDNQFLSVLVISMAIGWYGLIKSINPKSLPLSMIRCVSNFSKYSFGIYLVHIFVMRECLWKQQWMGQLSNSAQIPATIILTLIISYLIVYLISLLPFSEYTIAYKK